MIRVLIADDQALIRAGFAALINSAPDLEVVGEAIDGADALRQCITLTPDVVLILTTFEADEYVVAALRAGAGGFLGKGVEPTELLDAVRVVAAGDSLLSPRATRALIDRFLAQPSEVQLTTSPAELAVLTDREREIVAMVGRGLSNDQIAEELYLSPLTAKTHVNRAMTKLGARDRAQLVVIAYQSGLVRAGDA